MPRTLEALLGREDAERIIEFRRDLHRHPEIGMDTARTAEKLEAFLSTFPVDRVKRVEKNGVVALIKGREDGPMIGLRGDTDERSRKVRAPLRPRRPYGGGARNSALFV